jgi:hypothetical protein
MEGTGYLNGRRYLLQRSLQEVKFCHEFRESLATGGVQEHADTSEKSQSEPHAERWVRSIKEEWLSKLVFFGGNSLAERVRIPGTTVKNETAKARTIFCSSPSLLRKSAIRRVRSAVESLGA